MLKTLWFSSVFMVAGALTSVIYGAGAELAAEAPAPHVTVMDCKRKTANAHDLACVCALSDGTSYFCSFPLPVSPKTGRPQR